MDPFALSPLKYIVSPNKFDAEKARPRQQTIINIRQYTINSLYHEHAHSHVCGRKLKATKGATNAPEMSEVMIYVSEPLAETQYDLFNPDFEMRTKKRNSPKRVAPLSGKSLRSTSCRKIFASSGQKYKPSLGVVRVMNERLKEEVQLYEGQVEQMKNWLKMKDKQLDYYYAKFVYINKLSTMAPQLPNEPKE